MPGFIDMADGGRRQPYVIEVFYCTANLGRGVGTEEFKRNLLSVLKEASKYRYFVIFLQEIDEADTPNEHGLLRDFAGQFDYHMVGMESHVPMLISKSFSIEKQKVYFGAPGLVRLSPNRHWNTARITPNANQRLADIFKHNVASTHFPRWTPVLFTRWRTLRQKMEKIMGASTFFPWVYGMDCNIFGWKPIFPKRERTLNKCRLDRIQLVRPDEKQDFRFTYKKKKDGVLNGTIDGHDFPWVVMRFTERNRRAHTAI